MIKKIEEYLERRYQRHSKHPVFYLAKRYLIIAVVVCLILTDLIGENYYWEEMQYEGLAFKDEVAEYVVDLKDKIQTSRFYYWKDKALVDYTLEALNSCLAFAHDDGIKVAARFDDNDSIDNLDNAYLIMKEDIEEDHDVPNSSYLYCPQRYLKKVVEATLEKKKNDAPRWLYPYQGYYSNHNVDYINSFLFSWDIILLDGYKNGTQFRPGKVMIRPRMIHDFGEEQIIDCTASYNTEGYEYVEQFPPNQILFPEDYGTRETVAYRDIALMDTNIKNATWHKPVFIANSFFNEADFGVDVHLVVDESYLFKKAVYRIPFSFLKGDVAYGYYERIKDAEGNKHRIDVIAYAPGALDGIRKEFFHSMIKYYVLVFLILGIMAWLEYQKNYSLRSKNRFHKSLINSMAHDLKSPLMVMQGFGENLVENVHSEKREYYAGQILQNIKYLNELIDKNLDLSKKEDDVMVDRSPVYLMDLVGETKERYKEKLEDKQLKIEIVGETLVYGDPALLRAVIENLIGNAIKYAPEGDTIEVVGKTGSFAVSNKARLTYKKNINHLLDPLEMGDESRTAGSGTGLGLSIANGIVKEHGWRMKLSYKKRAKIFTVTILLNKNANNWRKYIV